MSSMRATPGVDCQRADRLENIGDGRRTRTWITVIVCHVREQAADTGSILFLYEDIAVIAVAADGGEYHRNATLSEVAGGCHPGRVIIHAAHRDIAGQVGADCHGLFKTKRCALDIGGCDALRGEISGQRRSEEHTS